MEVEEVTFRRPVSVGDLLRLRSWVAHTWVAPHNREMVRSRGRPLDSLPPSAPSSALTPASLPGHKGKPFARMHMYTHIFPRRAWHT